LEPSPLVQLLAAIDKLDIDAAMSLCGPDCRFATADGRQVEGRDNVRVLLRDFLSVLRSTAHEITSQWHQDNVWFAEVLANYEMKDWLQIEALPRAFVIRTAADGICDVRVYGANERRLGDQGTGEEPFRVGGRLVLPL
jgi:hypothetical protein